MQSEHKSFLRQALPALLIVFMMAGQLLCQERPSTPTASANPRDQLPFTNTRLTNLKPDLPTLFICGDSTAATGNASHRGWGAMLIDYFDTSKVNLVNYAQGGINFPRYYASRWPQVVAALKPGDFVVIELGHNGGHLPGTGNETRPGRGRNGSEVHTFGWYFRTFIRDAHAKGATPIVSTTTTRYLWTNPNAKFDSENGSLLSKNDNYNPTDDHVERGMGAVMPDGRRTMLVWAEQIAKEENVPFVDHSDITADLYEKRGREVVGKYHSDRTHTYTEGAAVNAETFIAGLKALPKMPLVNYLNDKGKAIPVYNATGRAPETTAAGVTIDGLIYPTNFTTIVTPKAGILGLRAIDIPRYTQTGPLPDPAPERHWVIAPVPHNPTLPTIWVIGDSTVRCGVNATGDDRPGQWGWGTPFVGYFDPNKVNVVNRAVGGTTSASFYNTLWKAMVDLFKAGDVVIMQFGTNSGRGELPGIGEESRQTAGRNGQPVTNHTYGWYIRKFVAETRAKGATPVVCSLIPRNARDKNGKIKRSVTSQAGWARDVATAQKADFIDLNELVARKYDAMEKSEVDELFAGSPHTGWTGAVLNTETVISGLKALKADPVAAYYLPQVKQIAPATDLTATSDQPRPSQ